jgi:hypothetical protein
MSFRRRALFLAGLFVAVSCSDAGSPIGPEGPEPAPAPAETFLMAIDCVVNEAWGTQSCAPAAPQMGGVPAAIDVGTPHVQLIMTNYVPTPTSATMDIAIRNVMTRQVMGTTDGLSADPYGFRVFFWDPSNPTLPNPRVLSKVNPADTAWVTVTTPDSAVFAGTQPVGAKRPYFQHAAQILNPGQTSTPRSWTFARQNVATWTYRAYVSTEVRWPRGWIEITPDNPVIENGAIDTLVAQVRGSYGQVHREGLRWNSSNTAVVTVSELSPVDTLAQITAVGEGTAWIRAVSSSTNPLDTLARRDSVLVTVNNKPVVPLDSINALTNVSVSLSSTRLRQGLAEGDSVVPSQVYDSEHGYAVIDANRAFTYVTDGGYSGVDTVRYDVTDGQWTVQRKLVVKVAPTNYWFVRQGATGDGSNTRPLGSINAASAAAGAGDSIFVLRNGSNDLVGAHTLGAGQALIGHGVPVSFLLKADGLNEPSRADTIFQGQGVGTPLMNTSAATLTLNSNNTVRGVNISSADAAAIHGVGFGTLTVGDVIVQAGGPALSLVNGNLAGSFMGLHSLNSDSAGLTLQDVGGTLTATGSSIGGAATAGISVSGGSVAISLPGDVTHGGTGRLLQVSSHSGSASFAGTLSATAGTGVLFSAASGTYAFNGVVSLAGGDAGLDLSSSDGVFTFANASVSNPSGGPAVHVTGGTPAVFYRGSITHNTGRAVLVDGITADSVVLRAAITSGTSGAPTGLGILVQNVTGGLVALDSTKSLFTAGNPAVTLNNAAGTVRFGHAMDITTTSGAGFTASGAGTVSVTGLNTVATGTGTPVSLTSVNTGTAGVTFSSVSTSTGAVNGIVLNGISGAGFQGTGGTVSGTTGPAVLLTSTSSADSVSLRGMSFSRSAGTGAVISGTTFGKLHVLNTSVTATGGPGALALTTGTMSGTYSTVSSNSSTGSGVSLTGVNGTFNASAGSINTAGAAAFLVSAGNVGGTISGTVAQASAFPLLSVAGDHTGTFTFAGNLTATNGNGLQFTAADGTYNLTASLTLGGAGSAVGNDAGIDIGSGSSGTVNVTPAGGNTAALTSPVGIAITVAGGSADLNYNGNVTQANNVALLSVTGGHTGDVAFPTGTLNASNGNGLQFDNADGTYDFDGTVTLQGGDAGIDVTNGSGGTFTFPTTANIVSPNTGNLISILNSAPNFTYSGGLTKANNNVTGINIQSNTGGTITFNGDATAADGDPADVARTISSGNGAGVSFASNAAGTTLTISGGGLNITSGSGAGFTATGGGTINVTGAGNTITSGTGAALNVQNTTIGASGLSFQSISHTGGATGNGIVLDNTGANNGLQVTGTGGVAGSGGTITNTQGTDGTTQGAGIYLNNTRAISLAFMALSGHQNWAIRGNSVVGFTMNKVRITGTNGTNTATDDGSIYFTELTGTASITGSFIDGGFEDGVLVDNTTGTLNRITFDGDTIGSSSEISGDGLRLEASGSAVLNATVQNTRFARAAGDMFQHNIIGSAQSDLDFLNNTLINGHPAISGGGGGVTITAAESGDLTYEINGNTIRGSKGVALVVNKPFGGAPGNGTMTGFIRNNTIGTVGATKNGSSEGSGMLIGLLAQGSHTTRIEDNQIYDYDEQGIFFNIGGTSQSVTGLTHNGTINATVVGNTIAEPLAAVGGLSQNGIHLNAGTNSTGGNDAYQVCIDVGSSTAADRNTVTGSGANGGEELRLRQRFATTVRLPGYTGANNNDAAVASYLLGRNTAATAVSTNTVPTGGGFINTSPAGSACPQP